MPSVPCPTSVRPPPSRTANSPRRSSRWRCPAEGRPARRRHDEGVRAETTAESCRSCVPPSTRRHDHGRQRSQISDGGAAVVVMSRAKAEELGVQPIGELVGYGQVAGPTRRCSSSRPTPSSRRWASGPHGRRHRLFEINEAFAAVGCASADYSGSAPASSTSTVAPSQWATRSACPAPAWPSPPCSSSSAGAAAPPPSVCAVVRPGDAAVLRTL